MNNHLVSYDALIDYWAGNLDPAKTAQIAQHVETCPSCKNRVVRLITIQALLQEDDSQEPPPRVIARAKSIVYRYRPLPPFQLPYGAWGSRAISFVGGFALAILVFLGLGLVVANQDIAPDNVLYPVQVTVKGLQVIASNAQKPKAVPAVRPTSPPQTIGIVPPAPPAPSPNLVISQVYGGGGNTGSAYTHDYIEIFNRGTITMSLTGWSLQYTSATGSGNLGATATQITELPSVWLAPGQYYLIQQGRGSGGTMPLPTPDFVDSTPMSLSATDGKLVLVNTITPLGCNGGSNPCSATLLEDVVDLLGFGKTDFFEGAGAAQAGSNTTAVIRANGGCTDTNNNITDFVDGTPQPHNTAWPHNVCAPATNKP